MKFSAPNRLIKSIASTETDCINHFIQIHTKSSNKMIIRSLFQSLSLTTGGIVVSSVRYTKALILKVEQAKAAMIMI